MIIYTVELVRVNIDTSLELIHVGLDLTVAEFIAKEEASSFGVPSVLKGWQDGKEISSKQYDY